jgi:hypothetical protein
MLSPVINYPVYLIRYNRFAMSNTSSASGDSRCITKDQWVIPPLILAICVISFGTLFSRLGFFQDDWHHVFYAYWQGSRGLQHFLFVDRGPFAWIVYAFLFKILGFSPESWHWWLMLLRAATSIMFWFSLRLIWPRQRSLAWWTALLFTIYPIFTLQPLSVAYAIPDVERFAEHEIFCAAHYGSSSVRSHTLGLYRIFLRT